ncbi:phage antirepressor KilAC domain-containing protein [Nonomuraea sp. CA-218870]|uniref:phage antirepressor KilAC domain-containing protein n=1 Tax=Nonomuraea sp. CA-218870 TaxID=3239998 RepID=UPI003D92034D
MNELALTESSALRREYVDRTDALDKVKFLRMMPDDLHVTTEMVAAYFEVGVKTIESLALDHREELEGNEHRVISGDELTSFKKVCGIHSRARSLALFTRRTVLNVGMLLRDSKVAKDVRTYLLNAERQQIAIPQDYPSALRALADEVDARKVAEQQRDALKPLAEAYADLMEADGTFDWAAVAQIFSRITGGLGRNNFLDLLRSDDLKILKANNTPYQVKPLDRYFKVIPTKAGNDSTPTTRVTPEGLDWLRKRLVKHFNHQSALFVIGEIA